MSEQILPLGHFEIRQQGELACAINKQVRHAAVADSLRSRNLLGVLARHGKDEQKSILKVFEARALHQSGKLGVYVLKAADVYVGMATVDPNPKLSKLKYSLPPKFAKGPLSTEVPVYGPEVTAWVNQYLDPDAEQHLSGVYKSLTDPTGLAQRQFETFRTTHPDVEEPIQAWTIEPLDSPPWVKRAIKSAGLLPTKDGTGLYDDGESRRHSPPPSKLYVALAPLS